MSVWFAIPCKRAPEEAERCLSKWRAQGYKIALWRDPEDAPVLAAITISRPYQGYHIAVNSLCREILAADPAADWIVTGGDDMEPDPRKRAEEIAAECSAHFEQSLWKAPGQMLEGLPVEAARTFGVMQPIGDRWGHPENINGSPWMGREFCRRMYGGAGPFFEGYPHMWGDEEQHDICLALGILWQRADLSHVHHHQMREGGRTPGWMRRNNECYVRFKPLFELRKRAGFPGHEPINV